MLTIFIANFRSGVRPATSILDHAEIWLSTFFIGSSFFPLFSLLFGMGFAIQLLRAEESGVSFMPRYLRRCAALLVIGVAHYTLLLYNGDILRPYAIIGITLLLFRKTATRMLLTVAVAALVFSAVFGDLQNAERHVRGIGQPQTVQGSSPPPAAPRQGQTRRPRTILPYSQRVAQRWSASIGAAQYREILYEDPDTPIIFAMFVLGLYAGRRGILRDPRAHRRLLVRTLIVCALLGAIGKFMALVLPAIQAGQIAFSEQISHLHSPWSIGGPVLSIAYACAGFLLVDSLGRRRKVLEPLASVGRMALTTYLLESVIAIFLLPWLWPGWRGHFSPASLTGFKLLIICGLIGVSMVWMRRFAYGPVEWLWRSITYWRLQPLTNGRTRAVHASQ